jgi:hypothetical protein
LSYITKDKENKDKENKVEKINSSNLYFLCDSKFNNKTGGGKKKYKNKKNIKNNKE